MITLTERNALIVPDLAIDVVGPWFHLPTTDFLCVLLSLNILTAGNRTNNVLVEGTSDPAKNDIVVFTGGFGDDSVVGASTQLMPVNAVLSEWFRLHYVHNASDIATGSARVRAVGRG